MACNALMTPSTSILDHRYTPTDSPAARSLA